MVEFDVDSERDCWSAQVKEAVSEAEKDMSLKLVLETAEKGGCDETYGNLYHVIHELLIGRYGSPKLADLFYDNACVPYVEFEWNGWTMTSLRGPMRFAAKPWSKLNRKTKEKAVRDSAEVKPGTDVFGSWGRIISYGEPVSRYTCDGTLKQEYAKNEA